MLASKLTLLFASWTLLVSCGAASPESDAEISAFERCGDDVVGACAAGTRCSTGVPSFCLPLSSFANATLSPGIAVTGYGRPIGVPQTSDDDPEPTVFLACTDANFAGSCYEQAVACNFCFALPAEFQNDISSIQILYSPVGCNFWVSSDCVGDGLKVDSGAIYDLSATNYNDRTVAANCYLH